MCNFTEFTLSVTCMTYVLEQQGTGEGTTRASNSHSDHTPVEGPTMVSSLNHDACGLPNLPPKQCRSVVSISQLRLPRSPTSSATGTVKSLVLHIKLSLSRTAYTPVVTICVERAADLCVPKKMFARPGFPRTERNKASMYYISKTNFGSSVVVL